MRAVLAASLLLTACTSAAPADDTDDWGADGAADGASCHVPTRRDSLDVFVGPTDWQASIEQQIDAATKSIDVQMYLFTVTDIAQHIIDAQARGVAVRVLLDPHEDNSVVQAMLTKAKVPNHTDPTVFSFAHAKYMVIDKDTAVILSGNFNVGAVNTERNYGIVDTNTKDVADLEKIFTNDWAATTPSLSCSTRLIVSPVNSADRILAHVASAKSTLDIEVLYLDDTSIRAAVVAAHARGVAVRIMLSDPMKNPQNTATQAYFNGKGIATKILLTNYLHTKMIQADGVALVGSENMSTTSLTKNREVGLLVDVDDAQPIHDQYERDWAAAN